jgi:ARG and Rhodanese-Phosphatase-superfamily-associated Protein domain
VASLFPRLKPRAEYVTLEEALPLGFRVAEVDAAGSVPEPAVTNPLDANVLLYDGEELLGAKQNRILNVTVLVAPRSETRIPVSCVEEGRWRARSFYFGAARHAAYPELRRRKAARLSAAPFERGAAQGEVWQALAEKAGRLGVHSPTGAQADVFSTYERDLGLLRGAFPLQSGQSGALLAIDEQFCLDYVSRPEAFARLYPKLLEGYLLDALEEVDSRPAGDLDAFIAVVAEGALARRPSAGLGEDVRLRGEAVVASGLEIDGELVQLCAFSTENGGSRTRIERPSRRS